MARVPELVDGTRIEDLVRARTARLTPEAHAMLAVSAVAARPISIALAARAAGVVGGHDQAAQLASERLATIRTVNGHAILVPVHDHVRAAVVASLEVESRAGWHEALARAFEDAGENELDAQAVVEHWLAAGHPAKAGSHAIAAAGRAEDALAFRRAAELYEIALAHGPSDAASQRDLLRRQARALASSGQLDDAAERYGRAALLLPDDLDAIDCERARIAALLRRGRIDDALPAGDQLLRRVGVKSPLGRGRSRARLGALWVQQRLRGLDFVERDAAACKPEDLMRLDVLYAIASGLAFADPAVGRVVQAELLHRALECGEPVRVVLALAQEMIYAAGVGSRSSSAVDAVGARLTALASRIGDPHLRGLADTAIGIAAYLRGRWGDARASLETGLAALHTHGAASRWEISVGETHWLGTAFYLGQWRTVIRDADTLLRDALDRGDVVAQLGVRTGSGIVGCLIADRADDARAQLVAAEQALAPGFSVPQVEAVLAACNVELYTGDAAAAARRLADAWADIERVGALRIQLLRVELTSLRARAIVADATRSPDDRARQARSFADAMVGEGVPWAVASGLLVRASAHALRSDADAALEALIAADEQLGVAGMAGVQWVAKLRIAELEGGPGGAARAAAARDQLRDLGAASPDTVAALFAPWPR
jgi:tetratricopeptide (TPR) repeat protein